MAIFGPKPCVNPFRKMSIFRVFELLVIIAQKGVFSLQNMVKDIFFAYIALKKKSWKNGQFWTKTMGYPLWKNVNFSSFLTSCFYSLERLFFFLKYRKRHFPCLYSLKKKSLEKWSFLDQNHGLTPFEKCQFFKFLNFLLLQPRKAFFRCRIW